MSRVRTFLALNFPLPLVRRIGEEIDKLRPAAAAIGWRVAWVPTANLHLTLKFLGGVEEAAIAAISGRLRRELTACEGLDLEVVGLGAFPDGNRPNIVWAGIQPTPALLTLQRSIECWMEELGFPREERPFHPHITLGRVKEAGEQPFAPLLDAQAALVLGAARASEVVIYESRTVRPHSEYVALGRIALGGRDERRV